MPSPTVRDYYDTLESRIGYWLLLGGTRHFGYYEEGTWWPFPLGTALRAMEDKLYQTLQLPSGSRVLDCGAGVGHVAISMAKRGLNVEAIELLRRHAEQALQNVASEHVEKKVHVTMQSYQDLSFEDRSFDGVYFMETLSHATEPERALEEVYRVLKPGCSVTLFEYEHSIIKDGPEKRALTEVNKYSSMPAFQNFIIGTIPKTLEVVGFEEVESQNISANVLPMLRLFFLVAYIPYLIIKLLGLESHFANAMAAVEFYRLHDHITYNIITARKPIN